MMSSRSSIPKLSFWQTIRGRLLLSAILVELVMLTLLVGNSLRLIDQYMTEQEHHHADQIAPVLIAALVAPMAQRDYATVQAVLEDSGRENQLTYLVVTNSSNTIVASSSWDKSQPLPQADATFDEFQKSKTTVFHVVRPIIAAGQNLGAIHFALDLSVIIAARNQMFFQGVSIAAIELLLSILLLSLLGLWLTRHLKALTEVSDEVARGNLLPAPLPESNDDIGRLCAAFNAMSHSVADRINELTNAHAVQSTLVELVSQEQFRMAALLSAMDVGVLLRDMNGLIAYENTAFRRILNLSPDQILVGKMANDILAKAIPKSLQLQSLGEEHDHTRIDTENSTPREFNMIGGRTITERIHIVTNESDQIIGQLYLYEDISAKKLADQQLVSAKEAAEASKNSQAAFLAIMSHEIRTPMNGVMGMTDLLLASKINAEQTEYLSWIQSSANSLLSVINEILDFSRIESGQMTIESQPFSLSDLLSEVIGLNAQSSKIKNVRLSWHADTELPPLMIGDPVRLRQILNNLISNAVKFTEMGEVTLTVSIPAHEDGKGDFALFSVRDTGIGIPANKFDQIFLPFTQADISTTRRFGGSGLGLAIVKRLVELLGGSISVSSVVGQGSTFYVQIPLNIPITINAAETDNAANSSQTLRSIRSIRILFVEDTPVNQRLGQLLLFKQGHQVTLAADGIDAVAAFEREPFDLVFMDMHMPNMDGMDATACIRSIEKASGSTKHTPIIALTANAMESDRKRCLDAGMDDFISKPFRSEQLAAIIEKYLSID